MYERRLNEDRCLIMTDFVCERAGNLVFLG
jgi:hypothetical protein